MPTALRMLEWINPVLNRIANTATKRFHNGHGVLMNSSDEVKRTASGQGARVPTVSTSATKARAGQPPIVREETRRNVLGFLPDELVREVGKYLPLRQWVALRQLGKEWVARVDGQPPFVLLEPDADTDKLLDQFLSDDTPEYAKRLGNLLGSVDVSRIMDNAGAEKIYRELAKAGSWDCVIANAGWWGDLENTSQAFNLRVIGAPLLRQLRQSSTQSIRKLSYYGEDLDRSDLSFVQEVQRSTCLQLTTLKTREVPHFLPFIAGNAEFSDLDLDLTSSEVLTRKTFQSLQQMQGAVRRLTLRSMASCDAGIIQGALCDKQLESLTLVSAKNNVDLLPWLSMPISSLKLVGCTVDATTFATALGSTRSLEILDLSRIELSRTSETFTNDDLGKKNRKALSACEKINILLWGLRGNRTIDRLVLYENDQDNILNSDPDNLFQVVLDHHTIKHFELTGLKGEWPALVAPDNPKAMEEIFLGMGSRGLFGLAHLLEHLTSLKQLSLRLYDYDYVRWNLKFLSMLPRLGVEVFSFDPFEPADCDFKNFESVPFKGFIWPGLRHLTLDVSDGYDSEGMAEAIGRTTTLEFLQLDRFHTDLMGKELIGGLKKNESLRAILINSCELQENEFEIKSSLIVAEIIEAIFDHPNIEYAFLDFNVIDTEDCMYLPFGYDSLLKQLKPGLHLSGTTESPPEGATPAEIQSVSDVYERIVQAAAPDTSDG